MSSALQQRLGLVPICWQTHRYQNFAIYALLSITVLAPLTVIDIPLLADYPNHVARMHILGNLNTETLFSQSYISRFDFTPNIAMDLMVPWLAKVMPLDIASRLFLGLILLSTLASVAFLHKTVTAQWSAWPLLVVLFLYHGSFMAGLANFSLGAGLVPAALALWITMRHAPPLGRIAAGSAVALVLFFCHLVAFGAYGLLIIGYEYVRARDKWSRRDGPGQAAKDFLIAGVTGLVPTALFARQFFNEASVPFAESMLAWGNWAWKAKALLAPLSNYHLTTDLITAGLLIGLVFWAWRTGRLEIDRRIAPGLALLALCFVLAPKGFWTGGVLDQRFAIIFAFIFIGSTSFRAVGKLIQFGLPTLLIALFLLRLGLITTTWIEHRDDLADIRSTLGLVEKGSKVLVVQPDNMPGIHLAPKRHIVFHHAAPMANLATLAVIDRSAFVSTIYAIPGQQPLRLKEPLQALGGLGVAKVPTLLDLAAAIEQDDDIVTAQVRDWWENFDYVFLIYGYGSGADDLRGDLPLATLRDGDIVDLFRIDRPG